MPSSCASRQRSRCSLSSSSPCLNCSATGRTTRGQPPGPTSRTTNTSERRGSSGGETLANDPGDKETQSCEERDSAEDDDPEEIVRPQCPGRRPSPSRQAALLRSPSIFLRRGEGFRRESLGLGEVSCGRCDRSNTPRALRTTQPARIKRVESTRRDSSGLVVNDRTNQAVDGRCRCD